MTLYFESEVDLPEETSWKEIYDEVVRTVLSMEKCPYECEISLSVVDTKRIRELNREHRGIDEITDVLSFPLISFKVPSDFNGIDKSSFNPDTNELMLGDIVICLERVFSQAEEYGHSLIREFAFLIAHSMLHLLGFDHEEKEDERLMTEKQEKALSSLGIKR